MKFKSHKKWKKWMNRSSMMGGIDISYDALVDLFGEPKVKTDEYKTDAEWNLSFHNEDDERVGFATIYNYKDGKNYLGSSGLDVKDIRDWHVGGSNRMSSLYMLQDLIEQEQPGISIVT
jgi:hypothetical protein